MRTFVFLTALTAVVLVSACSAENPLVPPPTATPVPTATAAPTATPYVAPTTAPVPPSNPTSAPAPTAAPVNPTAAPQPTLAPTAAPAGPSQASIGCLSTAQAVQMIKTSNSVGEAIKRLNEAFDLSGGNIGEGWLSGPFELRNPGPGGASLVWTDTLGQPWTVLTAGQTVEKNVFGLKTQGGWGTYAVFTAVKVPTPGRSIRLCEAVNLDQFR